MKLADNYLARTFVKNAIIELCIKKDWYTGGDVDEYSHMLDMSADGVNDNVRNVIALDIAEHSDDHVSQYDVKVALDAIYNYAILMHDLTDDVDWKIAIKLLYRDDYKYWKGNGDNRAISWVDDIADAEKFDYDKAESIYHQFSFRDPHLELAK